MSNACSFSSYSPPRKHFVLCDNSKSMLFLNLYRGYVMWIVQYPHVRTGVYYDKLYTVNKVKQSQVTNLTESNYMHRHNTSHTYFKVPREMPTDCG